MGVLSSVLLLPRRLDVFFVAIWVYIAMKLTQFRVRILRPNDAKRERTWSRTHARNGARLARLAQRRGALWLKFAQYVASRADVLPTEYIDALDVCLDAAPAMDATVVQSLVEAEVGLETFYDFDSTRPIASASIAQVHRARLRKNGKEVVVKVQRPGVRELLLQDLIDLGTILRVVAGAEPEFDFRPMLEAWMEMVPLETDFLHEMRNSDSVAAALTEARGSRFETAAFVPKIWPEHSTERVLVIDYVQGCSIRDEETLDDAHVDRDNIITQITKAFALQLLVLGRFTGDPHPGNFLIQLIENEGGESGPHMQATPALIDFGITVELTNEQRLGFCRTIVAAAENDSFSLLQSFADMGIKLNRADPQSSMDVIRHLFRSTASRDENKKSSIDFFKRQKERDDRAMDSGIAIDRRDEGEEVADAKTPGVLKRLWRRVKSKTDTDPEHTNVKTNSSSGRRNPLDAYPGFLVFMFRTLGLLRGLSTRLGVEHAYLPILYDYAKQALIDAVPEDIQMKNIVYVEENDTKLSKAMSSRKAKRARRVVVKLLEELHERGMFVGCQVAAYHDGKLVLDVAAGQVGKHNPRPVRPDTLFCCFSVTKGIMAILFAELADEFGIENGDLVCKYWPEFGCKGKEKTTIGELLSHRAGLGQVAPDNMSMVRLRDDWNGIIDWLAKDAEPAHAPGEREVYHYLTFGWLVAGLIQKVSKSTLESRLRSFAEKIGISDECFIGLPSQLCPDVADSRIATLRSEIQGDILRMYRLRQKRDAVSSEDHSESDQLFANVDKLYSGESGQIGGHGSIKEVLDLLNKEKSSDKNEGSETDGKSEKDPKSRGGQIEDLFAKTPYLVVSSSLSVHNDVITTNSFFCRSRNTLVTL